MYRYDSMSSCTLQVKGMLRIIIYKNVLTSNIPQKRERKIKYHDGVQFNIQSLKCRNYVHFLLFR